MSKPGSNGAHLEPALLDGGIAVVTLDHFPVNSLSLNVTNGLTRSILNLEPRIAKGEVKGVILRGAGRCFCAGADITSFGGAAGGEIVDLGRKKSDSFGFEELAVPVVAAIHGFALGGGFELSLGCHYRVIAAEAGVGLPEVNIGLLPGAQGTQRLPRLIGADNALKLMTTGDQVPAAQALKWGVVDAVCPPGGDLLAAAAQLCKQKAGQPLQRISQLPPPAAADFAKWRKDMAKGRVGEPAAQNIIGCVEAACKGPTFQDGAKAEQKLFGPLIRSPESAALRYMFFSERAAGKVDGIKAKPQKIKSVGIVGGGLMGGGIAMNCVNVGIPVKILEVSDKALQRGLALIKTNYDRSVKRGSRTQASVDKALSILKGVLDYAELADCDLICEAVFEDIDVKKDIFRKLDKIAKPGAFLVSNTSALNIDKIAAATSRPEYVMGTHFFSPANVMKSLENVRGAKTNDLTIATCMEWGRVIGKWPMLAGNCPGFVGNRLIGHYNAQAELTLEVGALPVEVDKALEELGMKMGPLRMADMVGLGLGIQAKKKAGRYHPDKSIRDALTEANRMGMNHNQKGFYDYPDGRTATPSPEADAIIKSVAAKLGKPQRKYSVQELQMRLFAGLINEGFKTLEEGYAQRPSDIDVCYVHGYGFPRRRGGPMHWADSIGLDKIRATLVEMKYKPSALLDECIAAKKTLAQYWPKYAKNRPAKGLFEKKSKM